MSENSTTGAPTSPRTASSWRACVEGGGVLRGGVRVDLRHRREQRAVEVAVPQERQHVVLEDRLALAVAQERRPITGPGVQLDLAVAGVAAIEVVEDDQPVVEPLAPDAPLVHERPGVGLGLFRGDARIGEPGVDRRPAAPVRSSIASATDSARSRVAARSTSASS